METNEAHEAAGPGHGAPAGRGTAPRKLSEELAELQGRFAERSVTLREVIAVLRGRAYLLLVILLTLPFCVPVSPPGLSTPCGLVIALIALRLALGQRPWLPERLLRKELAPGFFGRLFAVTARVIRFLETFLRPRAIGFVEMPGLRNLHAIVMLVSAAVLLLPLPIPLTNLAPAWVILLIAAGLLERDGVFLVAGYGVFAAGLALLFFLGGATHELFDAVRRRLGL
jgi:hypothetical protein